MGGTAELDEGGELRAFTPANYVLGVGRIAGRPCAVGGEDFTIRGGSPSVAGLRKSVYAETLALRYRIPLIRLHEGGGGSVAGAGSGGGSPRPPGPDGLNNTPRFMSVMQAMGVAPVVSAALGPTAGMPAARLSASHFKLMVKDTSQVMVGGPALVERALGRTVDKEQLGGAAVHLKNGVIDNLAQDEQDAFAQIRRFLGYLPINVDQRAPRADTGDPPERREQALLSIIPRDRRKPYKMRVLCELLFDRDSFFELAPRFGPSQITGLARLHGRPVGVLANDPMYYGGAMTADAAEKLTRLVDLCDQFHLPIVSLVDQPGFMIGPQAESAGTIRRGTAAICAVMQSRVPWASVIVRKTYGVAGAAHFGPNGITFAWPSAETGALPLEGGVAVAFRREIAEAKDPQGRRRELESMLAARRDPYRGGESCSVHDLLDPRETRERLCRYLELCDPLLDAQLGPVSRGPRP